MDGIQGSGYGGQGSGIWLGIWRRSTTFAAFAKNHPPLLLLAKKELINIKKEENKKKGGKPLEKREDIDSADLLVQCF